MSPLELSSHNLTVYRNDPNYIRACLNIGMGVLAFVLLNNKVNLGLNLVYRLPVIYSYNLQELDLSWLHSLNEFGFHISDIKYRDKLFHYQNNFSNYEYYLELDGLNRNIGLLPFKDYKL